MKFILIFLSILVLVPDIKKHEEFRIRIIQDPGISKDDINYAELTLTEYYNCIIQTNNGFDVPNEFKLDTINGSKLIDYLSNKLNKASEYIVFLTDKGVALNDNANYSVRGLSKFDKNICIVSTLVITHETTSKQEFNELFAKVLIHEMGHLLGLKHCKESEQCVMVSSIPNPKKFYSANRMLCDKCLAKLDRTHVNKKFINPDF